VSFVGGQEAAQCHAEEVAGLSEEELLHKWLPNYLSSTFFEHLGCISNTHRQAIVK
jgi:hypothetical protein